MSGTKSKRSREHVRVIITDTCGRSFRRGREPGMPSAGAGLPRSAISGATPTSLVASFKITEEAVVDEIAGFANFVMGESNDGVPA